VPDATGRKNIRTGKLDLEKAWPAAELPTMLSHIFAAPSPQREIRAGELARQHIQQGQVAAIAKIDHRRPA